MKKLSVLLFISSLFTINLFLLQSVIAQKNTQSNDKLIKSKHAIPNRYVVVLNEDVVKVNDLLPAVLKDQVVTSVSNNLVSTYGGKINKLYSHALKGYAVEMTSTAAQKLSQDPRVKYVEEDFVVHKEETQFNVNWGLDRIDQRNRTLDTYYNYTTTGAGVHVYVLDSGIRGTHVDFGGRVVFGSDFVGDGQNGNDCDGHGTHVAGIVGSNTYGVAKQVTIHNVRVLNCQGDGLGSNILAAVDWVTANSAKPSVVNMSLGSIRASSSVETAITNSISSGISYALAAGNDNVDACGHAPGGQTPGAITVGATDINDVRAPFSNYGSCVDVFAPGYQIVSTWATSDTATSFESGTSMAAPYVAGAIARLLQANPNSSPAEIKASILNSATSGAITNAGGGSPNRLLYIEPGFTVPPPPTIIIGGFSSQPFPAAYTVSGLSGVIADTPGSIKIRINNFTHTYPDDLGFTLVAPNGVPFLIQSKAGGDRSAYNISYTISDDGITQIPSTLLEDKTTYKPTALSSIPASAQASPAGRYINVGNPGPAGNGGATLTSTFKDTNPNGVWRLYISDYNQHAGDSGTISSWSLEINTVAQAPDPVQNPPQGGRPGFIGSDSFTKGNWVSKYGTEGGLASFPSWAKIQIPNLSTYQWSAYGVQALIPALFDERNLIGYPYDSFATYYSPTQFEIPFEFNDGRTHRLAFYCADIDGRNRKQTFEIIDSASGAIIDTRTLSNFNGGKYLIWQLRGKFKVRITNAGGESPDAVFSAFFIDPLPKMPIPPPTANTPAKFIGLDSTTKGNWVGNYGSEGQIIAADTPITLPPLANFTVLGDDPKYTYVWADSTTDVRALQKATKKSDRIGSRFAASSSSTEYRMSFDLTDGQTHRLAFYNLFFNAQAATSQTFEIIDETGTVIDRQTINNNNDGVYALWEVKGKFTVYLKSDSLNAPAALSGIFLDPLKTVPKAPAVTANAISPTQVNVFWNQGAPSEEITSYNLRINGSTVIPNITYLSYAVKNLTPNTNYKFEVQAVNSLGVSDWSPPVGATTESLMPNAPTNVSPQAVSSSQINVFWNASTSPNIVSYNLRINGSTVIPNITYLSYAVKNLNPGTYTFEVQAVNSNSGASAWSAPVSATTNAVAIPNAPANVSPQVVSPNQINVFWNSSTSPNIASYNLRINGSSIITGITYLSYAVKNLTPNTAYTFELQAVDAGGAVSNWSAPANATTNAVAVPNAPTNVSPQVVSSSQINVFWNASTSPNITSYNLRVNGSSVIPNITYLSYAVKNLNSNTAYTFEVQAVDSNGKLSAWSAPVSASTSTILPPSTVSPQVLSPVQINIFWNGSASSNIVSYNLRINGSRLIYGITYLSYALNSLAANTTYTFEVQAVDASGEVSPWSAPVSATTSVILTPTNVSPQTVSSTQVNVFWNSSASPNVESYNLRVNGSTVVTGIRYLSYAVKSLTPNTTYTFEVQAVDANGAVSAWSAPVSAATNPVEPPPSAPINVSPQAVSTSQINVFWNASASPNVVSYNLRVDGSPAITGIRYLSYAVKNLTPNATYTFEVQAVDASGAVSAWSVPVRAMTNSVGPLNAPTNVSPQAVSRTVVNVFWEASVSPNIVSYNLRINGSAVITGITNLSYSVKDLNPGTTYIFDMQAVNASGATSAWSIPASVTTYPNPPSAPSVSLQVISSSQINVFWAKAPASENVSSYNLRVNGSSNVICCIPYLSYALKNLNPNTTYTVEVQAISTPQFSNWSTPVSAATLPGNPAQAFVIPQLFTDFEAINQKILMIGQRNNSSGSLFLSDQEFR